MLYHVLIAIVGIFFIMVFWYFFQHWVHKRSPEIPDDCDILQSKGTCHGCHMVDECEIAKFSKTHED